MEQTITTNSRLTVGMDLGDRFSHIHVLDESGQCIEEGRIATRAMELRQRFGGLAPCRIAIEAGTHSPWVSRLLADCGHEVLVANPRKLRAIYQSDIKTDRTDARYLALIARMEPQLLYPIQHRGVDTQTHRAWIRSRDVLVRTRTQLVNHVRSIVKSMGERLPACSTPAFARRVASSLPQALQPVLTPILTMISSLTQQIRDYEQCLEKLAEIHYPQTRTLRTIPGVGSLTSLAFVLTIEDPDRFKRSRSVGAYLGLCPRQDQSGDRSPQMRITKTGDDLLRRLLVNAARSASAGTWPRPKRPSRSSSGLT